MSDSTELPADSFEEPLRIAHSLMRQRKGEEACCFLLQAEERALSSGMPDDAALYSSVRGSYLVAMGRDASALEAYLGAERLSGGNTHYRLGTARHLVSAMARPEQALEIVDEVLKSETKSQSVRQEAHSIRGLAFLALEQSDRAIEELQAISLMLSLAAQPALSCDLTLVEELIRQRVAPRSCRSYLELVESIARENREERVLDNVLRLHAFLPAPGSSPAGEHDL